MRLRTSLFLVVVATAFPLALCALAISAVLLDHQYDNFVQVAKDRNRAFLTAVDTEVRGSIATLEVLTASRSLGLDDLEAFHTTASSALATQPQWLDIVLLAPDGRGLMSASRPWGAALPALPLEPSTLERVLRTREPAVGGVTRVGERFGIAMLVPVLRGGAPAYVLAAIVKPESFLPLIEQQRLPAGWVTGLVDAEGRFVARVPEKPIGSRASSGYLERVSGATEGWYRGPTVEGMDTYSAFTVSDQTGWSVGFAIPAEQVHGGYRRAAWIAGGSLLVVLALALGAAFWLSRRIAGPIARLSAAASTLGQGEAPVDATSGIQEVAELARALNEASAAILARDRDLRRQAAELQATDAKKSQFLALLSHELRNPLAPLASGLAVLGLSNDAQTIERTRGMMERQIAQLRRLIDDLLDVSRIDRGKLELQSETVALDAVVRNAIETARPNIEHHRHALAVQLAAEPLYVEGDPIRLGQVVANLLNNAAKFTPPGGRIEISARAEDGLAAIRVRDSGVGFAPADAARIFDMFVQLDASRTHATAGLGLGLTLVRSLVEMHGGRVEASSAGPGAGAEFVVRLLLVAPPAASPAVPAVAGAPRRDRVLVVDDNQDAADSLATLLRIEGFEVQACYAGDAALAAARDFRPDVAFIDLDMPGMTGIELALRLRAQPWARDLRLVALTGMGQKADIDGTHAAGFDAHLIKPAAAEQILRHASGAADEVDSVVAR